MRSFMIAMCLILSTHAAGAVRLIDEPCGKHSRAQWAQSNPVETTKTEDIVRAGWAIPKGSYLGYLDEAIASNAGVWACSDAQKQLFASIAAEKKIPHPGVVYGIAMNESKRNGKPWPWTINFAGKGFFFNSRIEAWQAANWLIRNGYTSFDIGLMQVNWKYHGHRFNSVWEAFQPSVNIAAACDFLLELHGQTGNWATAVKWYHNRKDSARNGAYFANFYKHFQMYLKDSNGS